MSPGVLLDDFFRLADVHQEIHMTGGDADWVIFSDSQVTKVSLTIIYRLAREMLCPDAGSTGA